jgi:uridylate kinase
MRRVVLKLSGEAVGPDVGLGVDVDRMAAVARQLKRAAERNVQIALVIGGGNLVRGKHLAEAGVNATAADYMGMLATVMNGLLLQDSLEKLGQPTSLQSAIDMGPVAEPFVPRRCVEQLEGGRIVILVAGTGNPHFTTDTAAALRAREIGAECVLKGTNVDGVYSGDPDVDPNATLYSTVTYTECLTQNLKVMDAAAIALCREAGIPIVVFNYKTPGNIERAVWGEAVGTRVGGA